MKYLVWAAISAAFFGGVALSQIDSTPDATAAPPACTTLTGEGLGWGPRDTHLAGTHLIKNIKVPPGRWQITAPVRLRWGSGTGFGPSIFFDDPFPTTPFTVVEVSDHLDIQRHFQSGYTDDEYTMVAYVETDILTALPLKITTGGDNTVLHVLDGDYIRLGCGP